MLHEMPSPASASVTVLPDEGVKEEPTAVQAFATHATPFSSLSVARAGSGVVWMVQEVPFHTSANVFVVPAAVLKKPTATHACAPTHDTPWSSLWMESAGLGVES